MRIIAVMNQKGGVGKTTTTVNLGAALAEAGKSVCLVDMDPQAHLTINYGLEPAPEQPSLYSIMVEQGSFLEAVHKLGKRLAVVPSSIDLAAAEVELVGVEGRETLFRDRIAAAEHDFDFILLDCPPSLGLLTLNGLVAAHEVIIPMQPHFLALHGVGKLLETVNLVQQGLNPGLKVSGIAFTMFDTQAKLSLEVVNELQSFLEEARDKQLPWSDAVLFKTRIRRNIKLAESPSFGQTIFQYDPTSNGAQDYRALAREVLSLGKLKSAASARALAVAESAVEGRAAAASGASAGAEHAPASAPAEPALCETESTGIENGGGQSGVENAGAGENVKS
jgi:chromosome partitioning protein